MLELPDRQVLVLYTLAFVLRDSYGSTLTHEKHKLSIILNHLL